jgi:hypothetical protein
MFCPSEYTARLLLSLLVFFVATDCNAVDFNTIERAWQDRQKRNIALNWSESRVITPPRSVEQGKEGQVFQDVPNMAMYFKDRKARLEGAVNIQSPEEHGGKNIGTLGSADARDLFFSGPRSFGTILAENRPFFAGQMNAWPSLLLYRGCSDHLCDFTLSVFRPPQGIVRDGEAGTVLLETSARHERLAPMHWVLTTRSDLNYAPIRLTGSIGEKSCFDLNIEVDQMRAGVPIPKSWSVSLLTDRGRLIGSVRARVTACAIGDTLDDSLFELEFPKGTIVTDMRPTARGGKERRFLVLASGEREITEAELLRGASIDEMRATPAGEAGLPRPASWTIWIFWANVAVVLVLGSLLLTKYFARIKALSQ